MDFELTDWAVDSNVLQLDRQLFSEKNQLTVPDLKQKVKTNEKRKNKMEENNQTEKKLKVDDVSTKPVEKSIREQKRDKRREKLQKLKAKKLKKAGLASMEPGIDNAEIKTGKKQKEDRSRQEALSEINNAGQEEKEKLENKTIVNNDSMDTDGKKRKKKKNSSKKNKYKHLDEARRALQGTSGDVDVTSGQKSPNTTDGTQTTNSSKSGETSKVVKKKRKKKKSKQKTVEESLLNEGDNKDFESDFQDMTKMRDKQMENQDRNKQLNVNKLRKNQDTKDERTETDNVQSSGKKDKKMTLRDKMMEQLKSARFRYLNEQLYTQTGSEAAILFREDTEAFQCYHDGFQNQVQKWPTNPVDVIITQIKAGSDKAVIGDFGCGDAKIARSVRNKVYSFDLVALNDYVTVCNIEKVPLPDNSLDIGIFCLSLMGTNLVEYLLEANRVIKMRGTLIIAEVTSRIQKIGKFIKSVEGLGFELVKKDTSNAMFVLSTFKKTKKYSGKVPDIQLEPCVYKRR